MYCFVVGLGLLLATFTVVVIIAGVTYGVAWSLYWITGKIIRYIGISFRFTYFESAMKWLAIMFIVLVISILIYNITTGIHTIGCQFLTENHYKH